MRYIDIVRAVVCNAQEKDIPALTCDEQRHHINAIRKKIDDIEIVVRCKNCLYRKKVGTSYYCELDEFNVKDEDFCSWGERKSGAE